MKDQIIQEYIFPKDNDSIYSGCDFHLGIEKENRFISTGISTTLKEENFITDNVKYLPCLILFYFNRHQKILEEWEKLETSFPKEDKDEIILDSTVLGDPLNPVLDKLKKINIRCVNLDYENQLYLCFKNLKISNPFYWSKIKGNEKNYFILFYINTFPVEFYTGPIDENKIKETYYKDGKDNYFSKFLVTETDLGKNFLEKKREEKFKVFDSLKLKGRYFKALEDNRPYNGIKKGRYYRIEEVKPGEFRAMEVYNY